MATLPRRKWTSRLACAVWRIRDKNKQRMGEVTPFVPTITLPDEPASPPEPDLDPGLYVGDLSNWSAARGKSTLSAFNDGAESVMTSSSPCGPSVKLSGLTAGNQYRLQFRFEQDDGAGYSSVRFDNSSGLYSGAIRSVSNPDVEMFDEILTAGSATMYLGALRINHGVAGAFVNISEVSVTGV